MALLMARFSGKHERHVADRKRTLLSELNGDILEIGPGTGVNLRYYGNGIHWIGIEPNPFMHPYLRQEAMRVGLKIDLRSGTAERMDIGDESVDAVVGTLVLCSVEDVRGTLREIQRVLRPGGRFVFLEHVAAPPKTWLRRLQRLVRPVSKLLADGCCPDRETWRVLVGAGFARVDYQSFRVPIPIAAPHIAGAAVKRPEGTAG
jgi:ubiquinone/menaquinone biosynthesis C-methylase UbiE